MSVDWFYRNDDEELPPLPGRTGVSRLRRTRTAPDVADIPEAPAGPSFVPLGPITALFGATVRRSAVSGRVRALAVSSDGVRAYAGTAGGLWYTNDEGASWVPLDATASSRFDGTLHAARALAVSALSVQFGANEAADRVVVGTGDPSLEGVLGPDGGRGIGIRSAVGPAAAPAWTREGANLTGTVVLALAHENADVVWAAASNGLYRRPAAAADRGDWERVRPGLFWDVVVTQAEGAEPMRIWAASDGKLEWATDGAAFTEVALPEDFPVGEGGREPIGRIRLAAGVGKRRDGPDEPVAWAVATGGRLWRVTAAGAFPVDGMPDDLSGPRENDRADFALAVGCVLRKAEEIVVAGGATRTKTPEAAASVYRTRALERDGRWTFPGGTDFETRVPPPLIGTGVPAGIHAIVVQPPPAPPVGPPPPQVPKTIWLATDGGVFRSADGGGHFIPCNDGLPTFETEHLADHARAEALLIVGANATGTLSGRALETWATLLRDGGGGVVIDPADGRRIAAQRRNGTWHLSYDGRAFTPVTWFNLPGGASLFLKAAYDAANSEESGRSADVSTPAAIVGPNGDTQLAIGTRRVWHTEDWGNSWHTLPSTEDPSVVSSGGRGPRTDQDLVDGEVLVLRWGTADQLYALTVNCVYLFRRTRVAAAPDTWRREPLYDGPALKPKKRKLRGAQIPPEMPRTNLVVHRADRAPHGSLYVTTSRSFEEDDEQHVWWFNGNNRWIECGLNVSAPAYAVTVDPASSDRVYVGTAVGLYRGVFQAPADAADDPTWSWTRLSAGLPEAPCVALSMHGGVRVIRAVISGRGVFEMPIEAAVLSSSANAAGTQTMLSTAGTPFLRLSLVGRELRCANTVSEPANRGVSTIITGNTDNSLTFQALPAAVAANDAFEVVIESVVPEPATPVFLRAHEYDLRRAVIPTDPRGPIPTAAATRPYSAASYEPLRLDASPDIRVRRAPGTAPAALADYPSAFAAGSSEPRTFEALAIQAGLRRGGDAVVPVTGIDDASLKPAVERALMSDEQNMARVWNQATGHGQLGNVYPLDAAVLTNSATAAGTHSTLSTAGTPFAGRSLVGRVLRFANTVAETANRGVSTIITAHTDSSLTFIALPAAVVASDAFEILDDTPGTSAAASTTLAQADPAGISTSLTGAGRTFVDVTVHTRAASAIASGRVAIVLLRAAFAGVTAAPPVPALPADWANQLRADQAQPVANRGAWLPVGWTYFDDATRQIIDITHELDASSPAVVTFAGTLPEGQWLLSAVALAEDDILNTTTTGMFTVAREQRQVALSSVHAVAEPVVTKHAFFEWHQSYPRQLGYTTPAGAPDDARLIVEDEHGTLKPKTRLHLCFLEHAVTSFDVVLPAGAWRASWSIEDSLGNDIATHPDPGFPANIATGWYAWRWDGRRDPVGALAAGLRGRYVLEGVYRSHLRIEPNPPVPGVRFDYFAEIRAEGNPYHVFVEGVPKNDDEMRDLIATNIGAAGEPLRRANGQRIPQDIWIAAYRGRIDDGHCVFLGRGIMEATETRPHPGHLQLWYGGIATPKDREYKGWLRRFNNPDRCQLQDLARTWPGRVRPANAANSLLLNATDGVPLNPYFDAEFGLVPPQQRKNFVQAHTGSRIWTGDDLTVGCTAVSPNVAPTEANAARRASARGIINSDASSFGLVNGPVAPANPIVPQFDNKQSKRAAPAPDTDRWARSDALLDDGHARSELTPAGFAGGNDEPLHMQDTLQSAVFGGYQTNEIPDANTNDEPALDANNAPELRIRCVMRDYRRGSTYHIYHHAVIVKHEMALVGANYQLVLWIPRKVIRGWNSAIPDEDHSNFYPPVAAPPVVPPPPGVAVPDTRGPSQQRDPLPENRRNLRVTGSVQIHWFIRHTDPLGVVTPYGPAIRGGGGAVYVVPLNTCRNTSNLPAATLGGPGLTPGLYESVCEYQLQIEPHGADQRWHLEPAVIDALSVSRVNGEAVGVGDGAARRFDLDHAHTFAHEISVNGVLQTSGYSIEPGAGARGVDRLVFSSPPANTVVITANYDVRAELAEEQLHVNAAGDMFVRGSSVLEIVRIP